MKTGQMAEDHALTLLQQAGLILVERNYRSRFGEIDLIMKDGKTLAFIEVRYRKSDRFGSAQESVNRRKQNRIAMTAACYLKQHRHDCPSRFDVAALKPGPEGWLLDWIKGAFHAE